MTYVTAYLEDIMSIKIKRRHDSFTDQFSRIFMVKIFIFASIIMTVDYFSDKVTCIIPPDSRLSEEFVHSYCWVQGFYIYDELKDRTTESGGHYGIPKDIAVDGITNDSKPCRREPGMFQPLEAECKEMTKLFFVQYQYFPFYIASLAILFCFPYMLFRINNGDLISLRTVLESQEGKPADDMKKIVDSYFHYRINGGKNFLQMKCIFNILIKMSYVFVNVLAFSTTNNLLNGNYTAYGLDWGKQSKLANTQAPKHNFRGSKAKSGNHLLPAIGLCDIEERSQSLRTTYMNSYRFICEISTHVLYQYILLVLWYLFIISITVSVLGLLLLLCFHARSFVIGFFKTGYSKRKSPLIGRCLTLRELEYLDFIREKNLTIYGDVVRLLFHEKREDIYNYDLDAEEYSKKDPLINRPMEMNQVNRREK